MDFRARRKPYTDAGAYPRDMRPRFSYDTDTALKSEQE